MNKQRKVLITTTYNEMGIIIDTKAEEVAQPEVAKDKNVPNNDCISRQAAIDALDKHIDTFDAIDTNYLCGLRTAMSILKEMPSAQPEVLDYGSGELVKDSQRLVEASSNDMISRQQAIEAFEPEHSTDWYTPRIIEVLETLPPAQPQWIPCSERLPDEFGEYLVTKKAIGWNCEEYTSNDIAYFDNERFHKADKVLAWMPLPKPYGGDTK